MANFPLSPVVVTATPNDGDTSNSGAEGACSASAIGLSTDVRYASESDAGLTGSNTPITHQYIGWGGDSTVSGQETADIPQIYAVDYGTGDFNDKPCIFNSALAQAAAGAVFRNPYVNLGTATIEIGEFTVGAAPVA